MTFKKRIGRCPPRASSPLTSGSVPARLVGRARARVAALLVAKGAVQALLPILHEMGLEAEGTTMMQELQAISSAIRKLWVNLEREITVATGDPELERLQFHVESKSRGFAAVWAVCLISSFAFAVAVVRTKSREEAAFFYYPQKGLFQRRLRRLHRCVPHWRWISQFPVESQPLEMYLCLLQN